MGQRWTEKEKAQVIELKKQHLTGKEISKRVGRSLGAVNSTIRRYREQTGEKGRVTMQVTVEEKKTIEELFEKGRTPTEVADATGRNIHSVYKQYAVFNEGKRESKEISSISHKERQHKKQKALQRQFDEHRLVPCGRVDHTESAVLRAAQDRRGIVRKYMLQGSQFAVLTKKGWEKVLELELLAE